MKRILSYIATVLLATAITAQAAVVSFAGVDDLTVGHEGADCVLAMKLNPAGIKPGRDREVYITPVLKSLDSNDSIVMPAVCVAGRNRYYSHLRNNDFAARDAAPTLLEAGSKATYNYRHATPWQEWMRHSELTFDTRTARCCDAPASAGSDLIARMDYTIPAVALDPNYIALTADSTIVIEAQGSAFVDFVVNLTDLDPKYRDNKNEIDKIIKSVDVVAQDPDAIITRITIKGYASPEGSYANNVRLAMGRTNTLKEYVSRDLQRRYANFNPDVMTTDYEPEDWDGLRRWLADTANHISHRAEILAIANDLNLEPDPRNTKIQQLYPAEYDYLLKEVYPALRHSDYTIRYSIRTDIDVAHLKELLVSNPERLRPVDYYLIAKTYPTGSANYERVMLKAAAQYPGDEEAAINAANIYMMRGDLDNAARYAAHTGHSPQALYTRANLAARLGDLDTAARLLAEAESKGLATAADQLKTIRALLDRETVTYY